MQSMLDSNDSNLAQVAQMERSPPRKEPVLQQAVERANWEGDLQEQALTREQQSSTELEKEIEDLKAQIEEEKELQATRSFELDSSILAKAAELQTNTAFLKSLKVHCKTVEQQSLNYERLLVFLETLVKYEEDFALNLDQFAAKCLQGETLGSLLAEPRATNLVKAKLKHRTLLGEFRIAYAELFTKEKAISKKLAPQVT